MWSQRYDWAKNTWGLVLSTVIIIDWCHTSKPCGKGDFDDKMWLEGNSGEVETQKKSISLRIYVVVFLIKPFPSYSKNHKTSQTKTHAVFLYQPARLQFVPAVLPRCHWHLLCSSHTTITATISRDLWIPQAGASLSARILMLCWHESDWMSKPKFRFFVLSMSFRPKADVLTIRIYRVFTLLRLQGHVNGVSVSIRLRLSSPKSQLDRWICPKQYQMLSSRKHGCKC